MPRFESLIAFHFDPRFFFFFLLREELIGEVVLTGIGVLKTMKNKDIRLFKRKTSWHRLVSAQLPIIYLYTLFLAYWRENLK